MVNATIFSDERLAGLSADFFHKLLTGNITLDEFALFMQRKNPFEIATPRSVDTFFLTVDYNHSLEAMVAAGRYNWKNNNITAKKFPITGTGIVEFEARYFHFDRDISSEDAIKEIQIADTTNPWMVAKIEHMLAHGSTFPEEQQKFLIVGLGSSTEVNGYQCVPYLDVHGPERNLFLSWFGSGWFPASRFLAVRKASRV